MELYQANIFGGSQKVIVKDSPPIKPKKLNKKNRILKAKLKTLHTLYEKIYELQNIGLLEQREVIVKKDLIIYPDEKQAEPIETIQMNLLSDIDKRIEITKEKLIMELTK